MHKNIGSVDKLIRIVVALVLAVLVFSKMVTGTLAVILGIAAILLVLTSLVGWCGLYTILGINTSKPCCTPDEKKDKDCGCCH